MRVALFTDNDFGKVNGVTTALTAVLHHAPSNIRITVYTADEAGTSTEGYVAVRSHGWPMPFYRDMTLHAPRASRYRRLLRDHGADVVHITTPGPVGLAGRRLAAAMGLPLVGSFHTDLAAYAAALSGSASLGRLMRAYLRWFYEPCERVLVPSDDTRHLLLDAHNQDRLALWTRGVDTTLFTPAKRSDALRRTWGVTDQRPAILYLGRVSREKGLHVLPAVSRSLTQLGIAHRIIVAGDGPMRPELRSALPDAAFTGMLDREAAAVALASADVLVFPSRTDTAGNVVLEAQASGLPVLVSDAGGPHENIVHGETGFVVPGRDVDTWLWWLLPLIRNRYLRERFGARARAYAEGRQWDTALEPLYRTYQDAASHHPACASRLTQVAQL